MIRPALSVHARKKAGISRLSYFHFPFFHINGSARNVNVILIADSLAYPFHRVSLQ
jgi:hypothetical protein